MLYKSLIFIKIKINVHIPRELETRPTYSYNSRKVKIFISYMIPKIAINQRQTSLKKNKPLESLTLNAPV